MKQYLDLMRDVLENGVWKDPAREGLPRTKEVFGRMMRFDLSEGFPLLTTKKMYTKGVVAELLWFLDGGINIKALVDNNVHIWDNDAYAYYKAHGGKLSKEEWLKEIGNYDIHTRMFYGEVGRIYGYQWRAFNGYFDQIKHVLKGLKTNPNSRYHIVTAWNPGAFAKHREHAALPACHVMFQFSVRGNKLDLSMLQRSCDVFLGVPFDIASYALLCHLFALELGLEPGEFVWMGNSVHLYENHIEQAKEQLSREPFKLCKVAIKKRSSVFDYILSDIAFNNYQYHPAIKAELIVGK